MILSVDPGQERVGFACWRPHGKLICKFAMTFEEALNYLASLPTSYTDIVFEDYRLRQGKAVAQSGSRMETSQIIGAIKLLCILRDMKWHCQSPQILRLTGFHAGVDLPKGHIEDAMSAYLHGYYWFETQGILKPVPTSERV